MKKFIYVFKRKIITLSLCLHNELNVYFTFIINLHLQFQYCNHNNNLQYCNHDNQFFLLKYWLALEIITSLPAKISLSVLGLYDYKLLLFEVALLIFLFRSPPLLHAVKLVNDDPMLTELGSKIAPPQEFWRFWSSCSFLRAAPTFYFNSKYPPQLDSPK